MEQNGVKINLDSAGTKIQLYILQLYTYVEAFLTFLNTLLYIYIYIYIYPR